ncbi:MAG: type II CAAX endopeptidase family protein [Chloroflexota bacterium]
MLTRTFHHRAFVENGCHGLNHPWRYLVVLLALFATQFGSTWVFSELFLTYIGQDRETYIIIGATIASLLPFAITLSVFIGLFCWLHQRSITSLWGSERQLRDLVVATVVLFSIVGGVYWLFGQRIDVALIPFNSLLLVVLIFATFVQVVAEELVFRSYLMQGLHSRNIRPRRIIVISAIIFALAHIGNVIADPGTSSQYLVYIFVIGYFLAWWTYLSNGIGFAVGAHFGLNAASTLFLTPFSHPVPVSGQGTPVDTVATEPSLIGLILGGVVLSGGVALIGLLVTVCFFGIGAFRHWQTVM